MSSKDPTDLSLKTEEECLGEQCSRIHPLATQCLVCLEPYYAHYDHVCPTSLKGGRTNPPQVGYFSGSNVKPAKR